MDQNWCKHRNMVGQ